MLPIQITIKDIPTSEALEAHIRKRADKLSRFSGRIISCRILLELYQKHKHHGKIFNLRIDLAVPGKELVVTRKYDQDIYVTIRDAFDAIERQLEEHSRKRHGRVKTHEGVLHGRVARIVSEEGYGFIEGADGSEYYFSVTNVSHPNFSQLAIGDAVEYLAEPVSDGWQARRVVRERKNHVVEAH